MTTTTRESAPPGVFLANLRALWAAEARLAAAVDAVDDEERLPLERTRSGEWTARAASGYLHSRVDPTAEARRFAESIPLEDKFCIVVAGFGLGYHLRAIHERLRGDAFIICTEPSMSTIATALACVDLSDLIASGKLVVLTSPDKARLHELLAPLNTLMMLGAQFVRHAPSARSNDAAHTEINDGITDFISYTRMTLTTLVSNSRITCRNIAMNLGTYVSTPPIDLLRGRFAGNPAIVVAAGPSLSRNIDQLAALRGRAVLCAVQTALRPLVQRGCEPDFVTSLDFHEISRKFFDGVEGLERIHLVAEPKAAWPVIDHYPGPVSLLDNHWARMVLGDELAGRGGLPAGATVAHLALYLALYMGCDPIILVGQDLAYTGHVFYVPGVEIHQAWRSELNRFQTLEQKEWERIARNRPILRKVRANDGGELYTDELLFTYLEQFEKDVSRSGRRIIQATEGGARIRGTEVMTLAAAVERYCTRPIDPSRFAYREQTRWWNPANLPRCRDELSARIAELDDARGVCEELLIVLGELNGLVDDPQRFNQRISRVDELRARVHLESRAYRMVSAATQLAELRRFSADRKIGAAELSDADRARRQIARDIEFITAVRDGTADVRGILVEALERVDAAGRRG